MLHRDNAPERNKNKLLTGHFKRLHTALEFLCDQTTIFRSVVFECERLIFFFFEANIIVDRPLVIPRNLTTPIGRDGPGPLCKRCSESVYVMDTHRKITRTNKN